MRVLRSLALGQNNLEHRIQTEAGHLVDAFANTKGKFTARITPRACPEMEQIMGVKVSQYIFTSNIDIFHISRTSTGFLIAFFTKDVLSAQLAI